jgi:hypothetical protein
MLAVAAVAGQKDRCVRFLEDCPETACMKAESPPRQ